MDYIPPPKFILPIGEIQLDKINRDNSPERQPHYSPPATGISSSREEELQSQQPIYQQQISLQQQQPYQQQVPLQEQFPPPSPPTRTQQFYQQSPQIQQPYNSIQNPKSSRSFQSARSKKTDSFEDENFNDSKNNSVDNNKRTVSFHKASDSTCFSDDSKKSNYIIRDYESDRSKTISSLKQFETVKPEVTTVVDDYSRWKFDLYLKRY